MTGEQFRSLGDLVGYRALPGRVCGGPAERGKDCLGFQGGLEIGEQHEQGTDLLPEQRSVDPGRHSVLTRRSW
ncbi:hypothetical protein GCM10027456_82510 [Kineosporia babensis]